MATHSNILAWRIPQTEELDELQSTRLQIVRYDLATAGMHVLQVFAGTNTNFFFKNICMYLAGLGLSCGMLDVYCIMQDLLLRHMDSPVTEHGLSRW